MALATPSLASWRGCQTQQGSFLPGSLASRKGSRLQEGASSSRAACSRPGHCPLPFLPAQRPRDLPGEMRALQGGSSKPSWGVALPPCWKGSSGPAGEARGGWHFSTRPAPAPRGLRMVPARCWQCRVKLAQLWSRYQRVLPQLDFGLGCCPVPGKPQCDCEQGAGPKSWPCVELGLVLSLCPGRVGGKVEMFSRVRLHGPMGEQESWPGGWRALPSASHREEATPSHLGSSICLSSSHQDPALRWS